MRLHLWNNCPRFWNIFRPKPWSEQHYSLGSECKGNSINERAMGIEPTSETWENCCLRFQIEYEAISLESAYGGRLPVLPCHTTVGLTSASCSSARVFAPRFL